jgi:2'-5' RNA ligase
MRAFISIKLSDDAIFEIKRIQTELKNSGLFEGKLTEEKNLHLTLKFLGEVSEEKVEEVRNRLRKIKFKGFKAKLGEMGVFSQSFIRIIWIKLEGQGVFDLQKQIDEALGGLFDKEFRFMGHITIARVKKVRNKSKFFEFLNKINVKEVEFKVTSFKLMKSELFPNGPRYNCLEEFSLS